MGFITDGELKQALIDIGYDLSADNFDVLRREIIDNVEDEKSFFDNGLVDLSEEGAPFYPDLNQNLLENSVIYEQTKPEFLNDAERTIKKSYECMKRSYSHMLEIAEGGSHGNDRFADLHNKFSHIKALFVNESDESGTVEDSPLGPRFQPRQTHTMNEEAETCMINQFLKENCLWPVSCPEPGRLPFRQDRIRTLDQYKKGWARLPPPGENKRLALRWKIREALVKRDIPVIKLTDASQFYMPERPEWQ